VFALVAAGFIALTAFEAVALTWLAAFETWLAAVCIWFAAFAIAALALLSAALTFLLAFAAELLAALSPQAIPKAVSAKRVESAIIFFMSKWTLLSFSKINLLIFTYYRLLSGIAPEPLNFGTNDNIVIRHTLVNS
jgi:hypothetical protein